ncbi:MAG: FHA domain-containing protein [Pseudomonadota bacterium]
MDKVADLVVQTGVRAGRVAELTRSEGGSLSIGRAFSNDLVITDSHVAPRQLELRYENGQWWLYVLDTTNATLVNGRRVEEQSIAVQSGDRITVGRTHFSVFAADHTVEHTRKLVLSNWLSNENYSPLTVVLFLLLVILTDLGISFAEGSTDLKWEQYVYASMWAAVLTFSWAALWAFMGRIIRHQPLFGLQLMATGSMLLVTTVLALGVEYLTSPLHSLRLQELSGWAVSFVALAALLHLNLLIASNLRNTGLVSIVLSSTIVGVIYGFSWFGDRGLEEFVSKAPYSKTLTPPLLGSRQGNSLQDYFDAVERGFANSRED